VRRIGILGTLAAIGLALLWYFTAERWSLLVDRLHTVPVETIRATPFGWNGIYLQFGDAIPGLAGLEGFNDPDGPKGAHWLDFTGPGPDYTRLATLETDANDKLVLVASGQRFVLAARAGTIPGDDGPVPAFGAEPGDTASLSLERSLVGWPLPVSLAGTYLSGAPAIWSRHLYYRLSWEKASGARLELVWRCSQGWESTNGWNNIGACEPIRIVITPPR
jgi:hypothetical protein